MILKTLPSEKNEKKSITVEIKFWNTSVNCWKDIKIFNLTLQKSNFRPVFIRKKYAGSKENSGSIKSSTYLFLSETTILGNFYLKLPNFMLK